MSPSPAIARLRLIGILFWLVGGGVIVFGWMGTAAVACVDCQVPYLLSGGAAGIGLIIVGSTLVLASAVFQAAERTAQLTAQLLGEAAAEAAESEPETPPKSDEASPTEADGTTVEEKAPVDAQSPK